MTVNGSDKTVLIGG